MVLLWHHSETCTCTRLSGEMWHQWLWKVCKEHVSSTGSKAKAHKATAAAQFKHTLPLHADSPHQPLFGMQKVKVIISETGDSSKDVKLIELCTCQSCPGSSK